MNLNQLDIIVSNVPQVCADLDISWIKRQIMLMMVLLSLRLVVTALCCHKIIWFLWKTFSQESLFISRLRM